MSYYFEVNVVQGTTKNIKFNKYTSAKFDTFEECYTNLVEFDCDKYFANMKNIVNHTIYYKNYGHIIDENFYEMQNTEEQLGISYDEFARIINLGA